MWSAQTQSVVRTVRLLNCVAVLADAATILLLVCMVRSESSGFHVWAAPVALALAGLATAVSVVSLAKVLRFHFPVDISAAEGKISPRPSTEVQAADADGSLRADSVRLFDEIDRVRESLDTANWEFADHVLGRLEENLSCCGVLAIRGENTFNRLRHQPIGGSGEDGDMILETVSPGFEAGGRVLRRARVRLASGGRRDV